MRTPTIWVTAAVLTLVAAAAPQGAHAQRSITAASGTTSIITRSQSELSVDAKDVGVTLLLADGVTGLPVEWFNNALLTVSAEKGKRTLFSKGDFVPGVKLEDRFGRFYYNEDLGYHAVYVNAAYEIIGRKIARYLDSAQTTLSLKESVGTSTSLGLGWNWKRHPTSGTLGLNVTATHNVALPSAKQTSQVCTSQAVAVDTAGMVVTVDSCAERYVGPIGTVPTGQFRVDYLTGRFPQRRLAARVQDSIRVDSVTRAAALKLANDHATAAKQAMDAADRALEAALTEVERRPASTAVQAYARAAERSRAAHAQRQTVAGVADSVKQAAERATAARATLEAKELAGATFGFISAASLNFERNKRSAYNFAFGPALYASLAPETIVGAILFEYLDATNALGETPKAWNRFSARLVIGVPF